MPSEDIGAGRGWLAETAGIGVRQFLNENPPSVLLTTVLPRPVLQFLFFVVLGGVLAGPDHHEYVLVGGPAFALMTAAVMVGEVPMTDKWSGTFFRIRSGRPSPFAVMVVRTLPYPVFGVLALTVCLLVVPPLSGNAELGLRLLGQLPVYALMSFTLCAAGLAFALLSLGKRAEVLVTNLLAYLTLVTAGIFLPPERVPFAGELATVLPVSNGLTAVRAALDGEPWLPSALAEIAVGAGWLLVGRLTMYVQIKRATRHGHDDYN